MGANVVQKLSHKHLAILDWLVLNPHRNMGECAEELGVTPPWLSRVVNSDLFRAELRRRRQGLEELQNGQITAKLTQIANKGLDAIVSSFDDKDTAKPFDATELALKALGYIGGRGTGPAAGTQVNIQQNTTLQVSAEDLAEAQELMLRAKRPKVIEAQKEEGHERELPAPSLYPTE